LAPSLWVFTHAAPQAVSGAVQVQAPPVQLCPVAQARPQVPQLATSLATLTQAPLQLVSPAAQVAVQAPCEQTCAPQAVPQAPQFMGSETRLTQVPLQLVYGAWHWHVLLRQFCPTPHTFPQAPQLLPSLGTQTVPQSSWPAGQVVPPTPPVPVAPVPPVYGLKYVGFSGAEQAPRAAQAKVTRKAR